MGRKGSEVGQDLDIDGLFWIEKFGWLRAQEIGRLLWPNIKHQIKYGERICRKWISDSKKYVIKRKLPLGAGSAYVLSSAGVRFLDEYGIQAKTGKDWGVTLQKNKDKSKKEDPEKKEDSVDWRPPSTWIHDLRSSSLLSLLHERGHEIKTETEIKKLAPGLVKIPDGLVKIKGSQTVCWVEVERAIKTGESLKELTNAIINIANKKAPIIGEWSAATEVIFAFSEEEKDSRGFNLSHQNRIIHAIKSTSKTDISVTFIKLKLRGFSVESISATKEDIKADEVELTLKKMNWHQEKSGEIWCRIPPYLSSIKRDDEKNWISEVFDTTENRKEWERTDSLEPRRIHRSTWPTITEAKRSCASTVSRLIRHT